MKKEEEKLSAQDKTADLTNEKMIEKFVSCGAANDSKRALQVFMVLFNLIIEKEHVEYRKINKRHFNKFGGPTFIT